MLDQAVFDTNAELLRCRALHDAGRYTEALAIARKCVQATHADFALHWKSLTAMGIVAGADEQFEAALQAHQHALSMALGNDDCWRIAMSWNNIGVVFIAAGAWDLAIECLSRITEDRRLVQAWPPYLAHGNLALCHLHLDYVRQGLESVRQALRLETPELITKNPRSFVTFRLTFVQLALRSNRVWPAEIRKRANEACGFAADKTDVHIVVLGDLVKASVEFAYGDRRQAMEVMESLRVEVRSTPQVMSDVLFALVQAGKFAGRREQVVSCLNEWSSHICADAASYAKSNFDIVSWLPAGEFLKDHLLENGWRDEVLPPLPERLREQMRRWRNA